jgi:hypothetical protein
VRRFNHRAIWRLVAPGLRDELFQFGSGAFHVSILFGIKPRELFPRLVVIGKLMQVARAFGNGLARIRGGICARSGFCRWAGFPARVPRVLAEADAVRLSFLDEHFERREVRDALCCKMGSLGAGKAVDDAIQGGLSAKPILQVIEVQVGYPMESVWEAIGGGGPCKDPGFQGLNGQVRVMEIVGLNLRQQERAWKIPWERGQLTFHLLHGRGIIAALSGTNCRGVTWLRLNFLTAAVEEAHEWTGQQRTDRGSPEDAEQNAADGDCDGNDERLGIISPERSGASEPEAFAEKEESAGDQAGAEEPTPGEPGGFMAALE